MTAARVLPLLLAACSLALGCTSDAGDAIHVLVGNAMGSTWRVKWHGQVAPAAVAAAVQAELDAADRTFSTWGRDSELLRFNAQRSTEPFPASELLRSAVTQSLAVAAASAGAFDPTIKPLVDLYRAAKIDPARQLTGPSTSAALTRIGHRHLHVEGTALRKDIADLELDLDGIVAGLCADRIGDRLRGLGVAGFMLEITGEVLCRGRKPDGSPWRIGIVDPDAAEPGHETALLTVSLLDAALCTSGDYRNFIVQDGTVHGHVFDPRTGANPTNGVVSVSVLARSCALADALGTALAVAGPANAAAVLEQCAEPSAGAWFVLADEDGNLRSEAIHWPEAFALDGRALPRRALPDGEREAAEAALASAVAAAAADPDDVAATVWHGRRLAYLGRFRDAIAVYTRGLALHPDEPHLLRHRGHRWITLRDLAAAERDLARAAALLRGQPDEIEADGKPVAGRPPHSTLQFNVHYHLGLARFLRGDFTGAEQALGDCLAVTHNDESLVAVTHWSWCARVRRDPRADTAAILAGITADMDVVENQAYHLLCRRYRGELRATDLADRAAGDPALAFGLAHHELVTGDRQRAETALRQLAHAAPWPSFGVIAAEAELGRLVSR